MAEYRLTRRARRDIEEIWRYTVERWSTDQAETYIGALLDAMETLAKNPSRGRPVENVRAGYRRQSVGAHMIFFKRAEYGVAIIRILHQRMDIESQLESD